MWHHGLQLATECVAVVKYILSDVHQFMITFLIVSTLPQSMIRFENGLDEKIESTIEFNFLRFVVHVIR